MEKIRVSKVDDVTLWRKGVRLEGTLHLMPHHLVFSHFPPPPTDASQLASAKPRKRELWITYPMISFCTYRPAPPASHQSPSIRLRCRDFTFFAFHFIGENKARDVYDSIRALTCKLGRLDRLLAFTYDPQPPEKAINGWEIYDARKEWKRLGINAKDSEKGWRISEINVDYSYSPTYPPLLVVPTKISDNVLNYAGKYRSRARIPALVYRHPINNCSITRSSQPRAGFRGNRSPQDEKLVAAIFATNSGWRTSQAPTPNPAGSSPDSSIVNLASSSADSSFVGLADAETLASGKTVEGLEDSSESEKDIPKVYGAQQRNMIVDARPTVNAYAMQAVGLGSENMEYYKGAQKAYLGIDNIHVMRKSLERVVEAMKDSDVTPLPPNRDLLVKSGWLDHISNLLDGSHLIARTVGIMHSHVLIHCSDGWDRTSQLSALSQLCLDPYYRTLEGFIVLVEKDWLSFGHMFRHRSGFLSSEKWFEIENERVGGRNGLNGTGSPGSGNAFENALLSAKGLFNRKNESRESLPEATDGEMQPFGDNAQTGGALRALSVPTSAAEEHRVTKVNEVSPVFHQFLDATYQLLCQYSTRFEFNERFLRRLLYHLYSCQYGTFLFDNEKERMEARAAERTRSVWDYFLSRRSEFINSKYDPTIDDSVRGQERMIFPRKGEVRWWAEVFGRQDEEMNSPAGPPTGVPTLTPATSNISNAPNGAMTPARSGASTPVFTAPVVTGIDTADEAVGVGTTMHPKAGASLSRGAADLAAGLANLGIGRSSGSPQRSRSPRVAREVMEVEMQ